MASMKKKENDQRKKKENDQRKKKVKIEIKDECYFEGERVQ